MTAALAKVYMYTYSPSVLDPSCQVTRETPLTFYDQNIDGVGGKWGWGGGGGGGL